MCACTSLQLFVLYLQVVASGQVQLHQHGHYGVVLGTYNPPQVVGWNYLVFCAKSHVICTHNHRLPCTQESAVKILSGSNFAMPQVIKVVIRET